jgi:hypothetical protein
MRNVVATAAVLLLCGGGLQPAAAAPLTEQQIVEQIRGLKFKAPVKSITISRDELPARLQAQFEKSLPYSISDWETILRALLLVEEGTTKVLPSLLELYEAQVLAYYDPLTRTYVMIRELPNAAAGVGSAELLNAGVAVHELTHALQDQHFNVGARDRELSDDTDANLAYHALLEGEASLVMLASMVEKMGGTFDAAIESDLLVNTLAAAATSEAVLGSSSAPRYFSEMLKFPYLEGLKFVVQAYRRGGWKELDRIHRNPPRSTREILHPEEYFEKTFTPAPFVDTPAAGVSRTLSVEHMGEFHWAFLVGAANARGWKTDRVTIAADPSCRPTVLVETTWDTPDAARRFHDAYLRVLDEKGVGNYARVDGNSVRVTYGIDRPLMERFIK